MLHNNPLPHEMCMMGIANGNPTLKKFFFIRNRA